MDQQYSGQSLLDLEVDPQVSRSLRETTRWTKFIGIVIAIFLGLILVGAIIGGASVSAGFESALQDSDSPMAALVGGAFFIILACAAVVSAVLLFFLFKFSAQTKEGLERQDQILFNNGLRSLKNYFMIYGILSMLWFIVVILLLVLSLFTQTTTV